MKIHPVGVESFHADGWTDRQTLQNKWSLFCNFANEPKKFLILLLIADFQMNPYKQTLHIFNWDYCPKFYTFHKSLRSLRSDA